MKKVIAFLRVSTSAQQIDSQSDKVIEQIHSDGYSDDEIEVIEEVESASQLAEQDRLGLQKLKHFIEENKQVSSVYVYEISRIARKEHILYSVREWLQQHHIQLICLVPYFKMFTSTWEISEDAAFTFSIFSTLSAQETRIRVARMQRGKLKKAAEGKLAVGTPIFGYDILQDKTIIINPEQANIIHEIFDRQEAGETCGSIGKDLWLRGIFPKCKKMHSVRCQVSYILRDERYAGIPTHNLKISYPPIITKEQFNKCKQLRQSAPARFRKNKQNNYQYICQGMLKTSTGLSLGPSVAQNRYAEMHEPQTSISMNMRITDNLVKYAIHQFLLNSGKNDEKNVENNNLLESREKLDMMNLEIDRKILELTEENSRINNRIIKGRMNENEGDKMIDENNKLIAELTEKKDSNIYERGLIENRLIYINSFLYESSSPLLETPQHYIDALRKHCEKIIVEKIGYGSFRLRFCWKAHTHDIYSFKSNTRGVHYWHDDEEICIE